ncbi:HTH-type transcriptional activator RhaS [Bacteroides pyogenes]|uniref:helix-turn-helix domain-containing protein n=1 Tax=Bacteroides pyogenes TaxID=310300 RepID=UPI001BA450D1|nr:helix-turn-helix domain-containing protein [Bacteroides pyogenes]MBR8720543.1 HTH-type transcriptional activator RhaS [Bacteroides pyogenes]MBR8725311.1 HTH-type transcriptional activator RhaS [Bacteroides pyogenes]MBR8738765.1 HTH-type transcriptional activator RhaS [Bacteroides pyogenes]MBR8754521.1 HTH-type transcriptional activator RhaS [Bacteroides pyogenes]MBR8787385.1 HTH-type transcriptional activator RhaS [Bacteroides pyogenes]
MNLEFPQVDLPSEVLAWTDVTEDILNIYRQSSRLQACIVDICMEGTLKATINLLDYEIHPNDLITLLPGSIIQLKDKTQKVRLCFAGFSSGCVERTNLIQSIGEVYSKLIEHPVIPLSKEIASYLKDYFSLISRISCNDTFEIVPELADISLQTILTSIHLIYRKIQKTTSNSNRKKEICRKLIQLINKHYKQERHAKFYAGLLGISLQHLSTTVKAVTGKTVSETIAYVIIMDAKAKLKGSDMTIKEIAYLLNFSNASFFGKYFKRHVGMTPLQFRNQ